MKANPNQIKIKKDYNLNYSANIYPRNQFNYKEIIKEQRTEFRNIPRYEEEEQLNYNRPKIILHKKGIPRYYEEEISYERPSSKHKNTNYQTYTDKGINNHKVIEDKSYKNSKNNYLNDFNGVKKSFEFEKKYNHSSGYTLRNSPKININEKYYKTESNNNNISSDRNLKNSFQDKKNIYQNEKNAKYENLQISNNYGNNNNKEYYEENEGKEIPDITPKYYRNNPLVKKGNVQKPKMYLNKIGNPLKTVAQKICNIVIKGQKKKKSKIKNIKIKKLM